VFILVDNQPWLSAKQSRSARLWQFMVTKVNQSRRAAAPRRPPETNNRSLASADPS